MFKRMIQALLAVVVFAAAPIYLAGCEQNEYKRTQVIEKKDQPVKQHEVVD